MKIAVQGCCHGELHKIYKKLQDICAQARESVDLLIICGDFQAMRSGDDLSSMACPPKYRHMGDFLDYFNGTSIAPVPTIFIGGNHEASNHLLDLYYGGWVCPNIYYMGNSGVVNFGGLRIAGISGIYNHHHYRMGHFEKPPLSPDMVRSAYHFREFEIEKLRMIKDPIDIFISHEWPAGIYRNGNVASLLKRKPYFKGEVESNQLGSSVLAELMDQVKPRYWFSAHMHVSFDAVKKYPDGKTVQFLALDKCLPHREHLRIVDVKVPRNDHEKHICYDKEWLGVLRHSEPFIYRLRDVWNISRSFHDLSRLHSNTRAVDHSLNRSEIIECPKTFNLETARLQTRQFFNRFLASPIESNLGVNPEEIQLDLT